VAGREGERLVAVLAELRRELEGLPHDEGAPRPGQSRVEGPLVEALIAELRRLAVASAGPSGTVQPALEGAAMVMRQELQDGDEARLAAYLPSFAFLVALPGLGRERALALSARAAELLDAS
jgi:hypothetical protein